MYVEGKIAKRLSASNKEAYLSSMQHFDLIEKSGSGVNSRGEKIMNTPAVICYTTPVFIYGQSCVGVDGYLQCTTYLASVVYTEICEGGGSNDDGGYVPPHGGGVTDPYIDCNGDRYGTAIRSVECGCIGGNTGITNCEQKTIIDSLRGYPCAQDLLRKFPTLRTEIANLVKNTFSANDNINVTFKVNVTLAGTTTDGRTIAPTGYVPGIADEETVELNPDVLKYATKEYILVTLYHEALHAYFNKMKHQLSPTEFTNRFGTISVNGGRTLFPEVDGHFEMAANNYLNGLRDVIRAFNPNFDITRAYSLAQAGVVQLSPANRAINDQERDTRQTGYTGTKCP